MKFAPVFLIKLAIITSMSLGVSSFAPLLAQAIFFLRPLNADLQPVGRGSSFAFELGNPAQERDYPVELYVTTREITLDGQEVNEREKAEEDFLVFPTQVVLKPGQFQTVRLNWVGDPEPAKELAFRLYAEQIALPEDEKQQTVQGTQIGITTLARYGASVYITPPGAQPNVVVESVEHQKSNTGENQLVITFENRGTAHQLLNNNFLFSLKSLSDPSKTLTTESLEGMPSVNLLAESRRRLTLPWPEGLPVGPVELTLQPK